MVDRLFTFVVTAGGKFAAMKLRKNVVIEQIRLPVVALPFDDRHIVRAQGVKVQQNLFDVLFCLSHKLLQRRR